MSAAEDDDVRKVLQAFEILSQEGHGSREVLMPRMQSFVDTHISSPVTWRQHLRTFAEGFFEQLERLLFRLVVGTARPPMDAEALHLLDFLSQQEKISKIDKGNAVWRRVLQRNPNGILTIVGPTARAIYFASSALVLLVLGFIGSFGVLLLQPFELLLALPWIFLFNLAVGRVARSIFDHTVGWKLLAYKLHHLCPHIRPSFSL